MADPLGTAGSPARSDGGSPGPPASASPEGPPEGPPEPAAPPGSVLREAARLARALFAGRPGTVTLALVLLVVSNVTETFGLLMLIPLIDAAGFGGAGAGQGTVSGIVAGLFEAAGLPLTLTPALSLFVALVVVRSLTAWQREVLLVRTRVGFVDRLREDLHRAVARARWETLVGRREADLRHVLTGEVRRIGLAVGHLLRIVVAAGVAAIPLGAAFLLSPGISALILAAGAALLALTWPLLRRSGILGERITDANREVFVQVQDFLSGLKSAKTQGAEGVHIARFGAAVAAMRERRLAAAATGALAFAVLQVGAAAALAAVVWVALSARDLPPSELAVVILLSARALAALGTVQHRAHDLANSVPAVRHARETLRALEAAAEERRAAPLPGAGPVPGRGEEGRLELRRALTFRAVSFRYESPSASPSDGRRDGPAGAGEPVSAGESAEVRTAGAALVGVDLELERGEFTVVTGPSGAGKSTLTDLALGLIRPTAGAVLVDGTPLAAGNLRRWRAACAVAPQDPYLFHGTLRANLAWPRPDLPADRLRAALESAAAAEFVARLPSGLDTVVGERGGRLSGGERQRIALARALLREPTLLVLDEATGALDAEAERRVVESLRSLTSRMTILAVTHRPRLREAADRVLRLEAGRLTGDSRPARPASGRSSGTSSGGGSSPGGSS